MRGVLAFLLLGCACGVSVSAEIDGGPTVNAGGSDAGSCDPIRQDCPSGSEACYPRPIGSSVCSQIGTQAKGGPCSQSTDCVRGFACKGGGYAVCHQICSPHGSTNTCGEGQECAMAGSAYGVCTPVGSYSACVYSGGLDHITLRHSEPARNLCAVISLVSPGTHSHAGLSVPANWAVDNAMTSRRDGGCAAEFAAEQGVFAHTVTGRIEFLIPDGGHLPTRAAAFVTLTSPADSGVPHTLEFFASNLQLGACF